MAYIASVILVACTAELSNRDCGIARRFQHFLLHRALHFRTIFVVDFAGDGERSCVDLESEGGQLRRLRTQRTLRR